MGFTISEYTILERWHTHIDHEVDHRKDNDKPCMPDVETEAVQTSIDAQEDQGQGMQIALDYQNFS